ncbi:hypothetical protein G6L37_03785 [Agrobacterium rubi]|nr:hypothetical protein [Agrobacterium rubi]NTF24470.1 hypothetical protein [Agrobacterium rubi]
MRMNKYVKNWLTGVGRPDLARKADIGDLPELRTEEARNLFSAFQRGEASSAEFLEDVFGIEARPGSQSDTRSSFGR